MIDINEYANVIGGFFFETYVVSASTELPRKNEYCPRLIKMPSCHKITPGWLLHGKDISRESLGFR